MRSMQTSWLPARQRACVLTRPGSCCGTGVWVYVWVGVLRGPWFTKDKSTKGAMVLLTQNTSALHVSAPRQRPFAHHVSAPHLHTTSAHRVSAPRQRTTSACHVSMPRQRATSVWRGRGVLWVVVWLVVCVALSCCCCESWVVCVCVRLRVWVFVCVLVACGCLCVLCVVVWLLMWCVRLFGLDLLCFTCLNAV